LRLLLTLAVLLRRYHGKNLLLTNASIELLNTHHENPQAKTTFLIPHHSDLEKVMGAFHESP